MIIISTTPIDTVLVFFFIIISRLLVIWMFWDVCMRFHVRVCLVVIDILLLLESLILRFTIKL